MAAEIPEQPHRPLTDFERELLRRLLEGPGPSVRAEVNELRGKLLQQLDQWLVTKVDAHGCLDFNLPAGADETEVQLVEGHAQDADGLPIEPILWVTRAGYPRTLEMVTYKESPTIKMPPAQEFRVWVSAELDTADPRWEYRAAVPSLTVELDPPATEVPAFSGDIAPLVYFLSFAFSARYGAQHELSKASMLLRGGDHKIDLKPLLTFADRDVDDPADDKELQRVWQDAAPLAECCRRVVQAIDADPAIREQLAEFPTLRDLIAGLGEVAGWAAERGARVRLTYTME